MGVTLDELLESSGISSLGETTEKVASDQSAQPNDDELVSALRKYAESEDEPKEETTVKAAAAKELAEKTAEILVIKKTIDEIEKVASLGIGESRHAKVAAFIKMALDKGYSKDQIAGCLKKIAAGEVGRALQYVGQKFARGKAFRASHKIDRIMEKEYRLLRDTLQRGNPGEIGKRLDEITGKLGKETREDLIERAGKEGIHIPRVARGYRRKGGKKYVIGKGDKTYEISSGQVKKYLGPGVGVVAGAVGAKALGGGSKKQREGRPVTIVQ